MSVWDDIDNITVAGVHVDADQLAQILDREAELHARIDWRVVARWCRDHPLQVRVFANRAQTTSTHLRKSFPDLAVRTVGQYRDPERRSPRCTVLVCFVPPGEQSPFDELPGRVLRHTEILGDLAART